jgi:hypothetical protein
MKSLACVVGHHRWTTHLEHGDEYEVCSRCGKVPEDLTVESYAEQQRLAAQQKRTKAGSVQR